ncbi:ABC transporter [Niveispirillum lacus]|uniref:ABC transporter n=1 Tax=Niveispirillum lacus TaxID=1981099 RepID=A0A255YYC3_9PROT|nr:VacJ family lipoprotein [Niveispirillum lacus]OYQ33684.1 ABC transporter [Niveispirillum lacus]
MSRPSTFPLLRRTAMATLLALSVATLPAAAQDGAPAPNGDESRVSDLQMAAGPAEDMNDPLEPVNRAIFWVNEGLDVVLIRPAAKVYRTVLPNPVQKGVRNVLRNLRSPLDLTNQLLQGDWQGAGDVLRRFTINSTIGLGGLMDVAADHGMPYEYESLDQTLAVWGIPEGPYLVLPLLGPSSVRDATGFAGEFFADPVSNYASNTNQDWITLSRGTLTALDTRAEYIEALDDVKRNSFDYYASMRSLYRQRRDGWIRDGKPDVEQMPDIPDYE